MIRGSVFIKLVLVLVFIGFSVMDIYAQDKKVPIVPFKQKGEWKIVSFRTDPSCYTTPVNRDTPFSIKAIFECKKDGLKQVVCEDLTIKFYWKSNIEQFEKKINLTKAIESNCGGARSCQIRFNGDIMEVNAEPNRISIGKVAYVSPRVTTIELTMEAYTGVNLTDRKWISFNPCPIPSAGYIPQIDFENVGGNYIKITIYDLGRRRSGIINAFVKISNPAFNGTLTFTEDTTNFGVFSVVRPFVWTQGVSCEVTYIDSGNVQRNWRYVVP